MASIKQQVSRELERLAVRCPVSFSVVTMKYFRSLTPHIFGYELRRCGKVIWGDDAVLRAIPEFEPQDIPKEDAFRMLANRAIELLECAASDLTADLPVSRQLRYRTAKLWLDMASSYLLFQDAFEAGYRRRAEILGQMAELRPDHPFPSLEQFVERVQAATAYKLRGGNCFCSNGAQEIFAAIRHATALWRWELKQLNTSATAMPKQSIAARMRGWAFVARKCGWEGTWRYGRRWLAGGHRLSPRYSIYAAAKEILFCLEAQTAASSSMRSLADVARLLPVGKREQHPDWRQIAIEVGWNYHEFLEATRA